MNDKNFLKVVYWNAHSVIQKKDEIKVFVESNMIDIALISETFLKPCHSFRLPNYVTYRTDRPIRSGGGTAILVRKEIRHEEITANTEEMETTGIRIYTKKGPMNIYSAYCQPCKDVTENDVKNIFNTNQTTILAGDLNAKHTAWHSRVTNNKGKQLRRIALQNNLSVDAPTEATHIHESTKTTDVLDIIVIKNLTCKYTLTTINDLSSDHQPVLMAIQLDPHTTKREIKCTNWHQFKETIKIRPIVINSTQDIDLMAKQLREDITEAVNNSSKTRTVDTRTDIPDYIKTKINRKRQILKQYKRTLHPETKTLLNQITNEVKEDIRAHFNRKWENKLENLDIEDNTLWDTARALKLVDNKRKIPPLVTDQGIITETKRKAEAFADALEATFCPNPPDSNKHQQFILEIEAQTDKLQPSNKTEIESTTDEEILTIIKNLKIKKAPGRDNVPNAALKNLPHEGIRALREIFNAALERSYFPHEWKQAAIVMIHKPNKPKNKTDSYRPISLLSGLSKVYERVIQSRLLSDTEDKNVIPDFQFGFKREHATTQQLLRITEHINNNFRTSTPTAAVLLDVEKAFDRVWHAGLLYKLQQFEIRHDMVTLIRQYLLNRTFSVKIDGEESTTRSIKAGVPQGSVLGPLLYNIYTSDIPRPTRSEIGQFADDTIVYYSNRKPTSIKIALQKDLNQISIWFSKWRIKINERKTQAILFTPRIRHKRPDEIILNNHRIEWQRSVKYLGLTLDTTLTYNEHVKNIKRKLGLARKWLYPLINDKSKVTVENKIRLIKTMMIPVATYAGEIWFQCCDTQRNKIQGYLNKTVRAAANAPWFIRNAQLRRELEILTLEEILYQQTDKTIDSMTSHTNPLIRRAVDLNRHRQNKWKSIHKMKRKTDDHEEAPIAKKMQLE